MSGALHLLALLPLCALAACRGADVRPDVASEFVEVIEAVPSFAEEGRGKLLVTVDLLPLGEDGVAESVDWELWLNTRHFASGVQSVTRVTTSREKQRITFEAPLLFRGLPSSSERTLLTVSVRGGVRMRLRTTEARYPFEHVSKQVLLNVPVFEGAEDQ